MHRTKTDHAEYQPHHFNAAIQHMCSMGYNKPRQLLSIHHGEEKTVAVYTWSLLCISDSFRAVFHRLSPCLYVQPCDHLIVCSSRNRSDADFGTQSPGPSTTPEALPGDADSTLPDQVRDEWAQSMDDDTDDGVIGCHLARRCDRWGKNVSEDVCGFVEPLCPARWHPGGRAVGFRRDELSLAGQLPLTSRGPNQMARSMGLPRCCHSGQYRCVSDLAESDCR